MYVLGGCYWVLWVCSFRVSGEMWERESDCILVFCRYCFCYFLYGYYGC